MEMDLNFKANNILKGNIYAASITAGKLFQQNNITVLTLNLTLWKFLTLQKTSSNN